MCQGGTSRRVGAIEIAYDDLGVERAVLTWTRPTEQHVVQHGRRGEPLELGPKLVRAAGALRGFVHQAHRPVEQLDDRRGARGARRVNLKHADLQQLEHRPRGVELTASQRPPEGLDAARTVASIEHIAKVLGDLRVEAGLGGNMQVGRYALAEVAQFVHLAHPLHEQVVR